MRVIELKIWPQYFVCVQNGAKKFEIRKNDRDYKEGDVLHLREWDPDKVSEDKYTGRSILAKVGYVLHGHMAGFGLEEGYCIMSIEVIS